MNWITMQVGTLCIIGGNAVNETDPLATLEGELYDEFEDRGIASEVFASAKESNPIGDFFLTISAEALQRPSPYSAVASVFLAHLDKDIDKSRCCSKIQIFPRHTGGTLGF